MNYKQRVIKALQEKHGIPLEEAGRSLNRLDLAYYRQKHTAGELAEFIATIATQMPPDNVRRAIQNMINLAVRDDTIDDIDSCFIITIWQMNQLRQAIGLKPLTNKLHPEEETS